MKVISWVKSKLFLMGSIFIEIFLSFSLLSTPVLADPIIDNSNIDSTSNVIDNSNTDSSSNNLNNTATPRDPETVINNTGTDAPSDPLDNTGTDPESTPLDNSGTDSDLNICSEESGALSWSICPTTGFLAKITDGIYNIISDFLVINPLTSDSDSPFHQVWAIFRDITNVVFIILLLVVIYSQLTGIGLSNYDIKRILPKVVVTAILINLSYIICALAVDLSNIIGASLRGLFTNVESSITVTGILAETSTASAEFGYATIAAALTGGIALAGITIGATGGLGYLFFSLLAVLLGAVVSVIIAFITIAARQAFVYILIMVSPLAFVCMLLPNTESWFTKWKNGLSQMLFFYPIFSALFGACSLVGWVIIAAAETPIMIIFGLAVKVVPLISAWSLLKMSGTLPGQISSLLTKFSQRPVGSAKAYFSSRAALNRARYTAKQLQSPFNPLRPGGSIHASIARNRARRMALTRSYGLQIKGILDEDYMARMEGKKIVGYTADGAPIYKKDKNKVIGYTESGHPIYATQIRETKELRSEYYSREIALRNSASKARLDNSMSTMGTYLEANDIVPTSNLLMRTRRQGENYTELMTQVNAKRRNDIADKRWYANQLREASKRDSSGNLVNHEAYNRLITRGAGSDAFVSSYLTGQELRDAETARSAALASVEADAIDALEAERKAITAKYTTYMSKQVTKEVLRTYEQMLEAKDIEGICAAQSTLAQRGDYDRIVQHLQTYMDREGYVKLGSDFANVLALNLLSMKDADPELARLGKHINVETWAYTDGKRTSDFVTYKEFMTGKTSDGGKPKYFADTLMRGTSVKGIDRTFYDGLKSSMDKYFVADNFDGNQAEADDARQHLMEQMLPQIVSALPTFNSGSEQIINTLNFLTGMSCDAKGKWYIKDRAKDTSLKTVYEYITEKYLTSLTPNDLVSLKSDTFDALKARFLDFYGSEAEAQNKFREFTQKQCDALRVGDQSALAPMKTKVREYLGL